METVWLCVSVGIFFLILWVSQKRIVSLNTKLQKDIAILKNQISDNIHNKDCYIQTISTKNVESAPNQFLKTDQALSNIQSFSLQAKNDNSEILFSRTSPKDISLENYISIATGEVIQITPLLLQKGLFTATVSPELLTKFANGSFSTMVKGMNGKIIQHAGFVSATSRVLTPAILFQITSIITAQYYLNIINNNFKALARKLEDLKRYVKYDKWAELENIQEQIVEIQNNPYPQIEDLVLIKQLESKLGSLQKYYIHEIEYLSANEERIKKMTVSKQLNELEQKLREDDFIFQAKMLFGIEETQQILKFILLYVNYKIAKEQESTSRRQRVNMLANEILQWNPSDSFSNQRGKKLIDKYYNYFLQQAKSVNPLFKSGEEKRLNFSKIINKMRTELKSEQDFKNFLNLQNSLRTLWRKEQKIFYTQNKQGEDILLIEESVLKEQE